MTEYAQAVLASYGTDPAGARIDIVVADGPPQPAPGEVLVEVVSAGVNPVDAWARAGLIAAVLPPLPVPLGWDVHGTVVSIGGGVGSLAVGEEVLGLARFPQPAGTFATHATVPADHLAVRPPGLDALAAGALPLVALTAMQALQDIAHVRPGQRVLVHGASGGVGHVAVQLAKHLGAHVTGTSRAANLAFLRDLGVDEAVDHSAGPVEETLQGETFDVVLNPVDRAGLVDRSVALVRPGGTIVAIAHEPHDEALAERHEVRVRQFLVQPDAAKVAAAAALAADGVVQPTIAATYALADVGSALDAAAAGRGPGKHVLVIR
jgi:NADPH:quinone reductase-like Zn-dependent oxidoreductase